MNDLTVAQIRAGISEVYMDDKEYMLIVHNPGAMFSHFLDVRYDEVTGKITKTFERGDSHRGSYMTKEVADYFNDRTAFIGHVVNMK